MNRISNKYTLNIILLFSLVISSSSLKSQIVDGIAAIVGDEIILKSEVDQFAQTQALRMRIDPSRNPSRYQSIWRKTLETMIDQKILLDRAELDSIEVSEKEVEQALNQQIDGIIQRVGSREKAEEILGYPISKLRRNYREEIRKQRLVEKIQQQKFNDITVGRREVEEFFSQYADSLPEINPGVKISHILIEIKAGSNADSIALNKIDSILTTIKSGGDFSELASLYSDDTNSALNGGELGFMKRGTLVPEFEEAAYSLSPGEISEIVRTEFGYHIIKLIERRGERINVKHILIMPKTGKYDEDKVVILLKDLRARIISGESFEDVAGEYSDDPEVAVNNGNLGWYDLTSLSIPQFVEVLDTLKVGNISKPIKTDYGYHIIKSIEIREGGKLTLKDNWYELESIVIRNKRLQVYNEWLDSIRDEVYIDIKM
ncbi:MAG: peptidylprolyl isomerase [Candidatus Marinimicrobia bacterium]|nr:peptidylprolyl isomerase [Candidatus Neomarinimicrobiota bacterium]